MADGVFLNINLRFSQTNNFSQVINWQSLTPSQYMSSVIRAFLEKNELKLFVCQAVLVLARLQSLSTKP